MRKLDTIAVHCFATRPDWMQNNSVEEQVEECRRWHVEDRGWSDIGYHFIIGRNGDVVEGRPIEKQGAHVANFNKSSVGIALVGGHGSGMYDAFSDHFTPEQGFALRELIGTLRAQFPTITKVMGHNDFPNVNKACPGFNVAQWLKSEPASAVQKTRISPVQSKTMQASAMDISTKAGAAVSAFTVLDGPAQYIVLGFVGLGVLFSLWIMRERLKKWADGVK